MDRSSRKELKIGLLLNGIYLFVNGVCPLPHFFMGCLFGFTIVFLLIGIIPDPLYQNLKNFKAGIKKKLHP